DKALIESTMAEEIQTLIPLIADVFVGFEEDTSIEQIIGTKLLETGKTLALAESCTGGKIAAQFTTHSGASGFFKGGVVAYDTNVKITVLGVQKQLITQHSVVSTEVAKAMALGVQKLLDSDYAIATTGNAGPAKGDSNADLGTVCIAIATPNQVYAQSFSFGKERHRVLIKSLNMALTLFQKEIFKN
ncbi:MAG: CinA family protein, partial [Bacteroidota bacterium]|nr:CinA family protein [Bacteroidota bacterium]